MATPDPVPQTPPAAGASREAHATSPVRRPFRFGVQVQRAASGRAWVELARRCEDLGYSTLTMPDHFDDQFAPTPALAAAAAATSTLRIGALVLDNDYRHPVVLAKELATLDVLSEGRLEIGLGAGWMRTDYDQAGIPLDRPGVRLERLGEAIEVLRGCMRGEPFSFEGAHYRVTEFTGTPLPVQAGGPPLLLGGGGPRMLRLAAREADIVGINPSLHSGAVDAATISGMLASTIDGKLDVVRAAAGERYAHLELNVRVFLATVGPEAAATREAIVASFGVDPAEIDASPFALLGHPDQLVDALLERRDRWGFSYIIVGVDQLDAFAPVVAALAGR